MVWSVSFSIMSTTGCRAVVSVSSSYAQTRSPICMSSMDFVPCWVCMSVPAGKQANTQDFNNFLATSSILLLRACLLSFLKAIFPKAFVADLATTFPAAFKVAMSKNLFCFIILKLINRKLKKYLVDVLVGFLPPSNCFLYNFVEVML